MHVICPRCNHGSNIVAPAGALLTCARCDGPFRMPETPADGAKTSKWRLRPSKKTLEKNLQRTTEQQATGSSQPSAAPNAPIPPTLEFDLVPFARPAPRAKLSILLVYLVVALLVVGSLLLAIVLAEKLNGR